MPRTSLTGLDQKRLRLWLVLFFLALSIPAGVLVRHAYSQLKWEAFHHYRGQAEELAARIDDRFMRLLDGEETRSFADYRFLVVAGDPAANFLQRSTLSAYPVASDIPGLIGWFQVDTRGLFTTPLLPQPDYRRTDYGISQKEREQRLQLQARIQRILSENRLVQGRDAQESEGEVSAVTTPRHRDRRASLDDAAYESDTQTGGRFSTDEDYGAAVREQEEASVPAQAAFDRLNRAPARRLAEKKQADSALGRVEDLKLEYRYQQAVPTAQALRQAPAEKAKVLGKRSLRKERGVLPESEAMPADQPVPALSAAKPDMRIRTFESEIDGFEFSLLDSGHLVLFRKVWRDGQRFVQGALIDQPVFLQGVIRTAFHETALSLMSDLVVAYQGDVLAVFSGKTSRGYLSSTENLHGELLHRARFSAPLSNLELIFSINRLPPGPGANVINWLAAILLLVLCSGFFALYRLGVKQIELARQQQDFVSAVSHELKTPLTSIRMYGEMLREGWATEDKRKTYYDYIHDESERLSRLISNVLQLARLTRNDLRLELKPVTVAELMDGIGSKVSSQIQRAGFELNLQCEGQARQAVIRVDVDSFSQIIINLVDNALKFSTAAEQRLIHIACQDPHEGEILFTVRDYGPGIAKNQMKKIFKLFYRAENELTRETIGTGIGLALVSQLAQAMGASVDVVNKTPGAEFRIVFLSSTSNAKIGYALYSTNHNM
jgi:signal transduction histidine kinase